jgi:hypothetical protein
MPTIRQFLQQAWLAQAAYSGFPEIAFGPSDASRNVMRNRLLVDARASDPQRNLAEAQAGRLRSGLNGFPSHHVVHHQANTASGFSATLLRHVHGQDRRMA